MKRARGFSSHAEWVHGMSGPYWGRHCSQFPQCVVRSRRERRYRALGSALATLFAR